MKKILTISINLLLFLLSDADPLKLVAGNRRVVKKDGATHTISKYYVVPNDYDSNSSTNSTEETQKTDHSYSKRLESNEGQVSTGHTSEGQTSEGQTSEDRTIDDQSDSKIDYNNIAGDFGIRLNEAHLKADRQGETSATESKKSVITSRRLEPDSSNLQVKPVINTHKINQIVTANESNVGYNTSDESSLIVENATQNSESSIEDEIDDNRSLLASLGTLVHENYTRNLDSFWKLIKLYIDTTIDEDELLAKIERLSLLLNIFTFLYKDTKLQKPTESIIDGIVDLLQIPFVSKSKIYRDKSTTNDSGGYSEECLRKCDNNRSKPRLHSNSTYLSELVGREAKDISALEKLELQKIQKDELNVQRVKTSNELGSNEVTVTNKPEVQNLLSVLTTPTLNNDDNYILDESVPSQSRFGSTETSINIDDLPKVIASNTQHLPWHIEDRTKAKLPQQVKDKKNDDVIWDIDTKENDDLPWHIEDRANANRTWHIDDKAHAKLPLHVHVTANDDLPWHIEDRANANRTWHIDDKAHAKLPLHVHVTANDDLPWHIEDRTNANRSWHIDDKAHAKLPLHVDVKANNDLPWHIEDRTNANRTWHIDDKTHAKLPLHVDVKANNDLPWHIEDRANANRPWHIDDRPYVNRPLHINDKAKNDLSWHIEDRTDDNLPWHIEDRKTIDNPSINGINQKPITVYHTSNGGKFLLHPNQPRVTKTVHTVDVQKTIEKPYQVYTYVTNPASYEIQNIREVQSNLSAISGNSFNIPTSNSVTKVVNSNEPSLNYFKSQYGSSNQPSNPQLKYTKHVSTSYDASNNVNPSVLLFENSHDKQNNQHKHIVDLKTETYTSKSKTNSDTKQKAPQLLYPNVPINTHDLLLSNNPVSISASTIADTSAEIPDLNQFENSNYYDSNINLNHKHPTNLQKDLISKAIKYTKYKETEDDFVKPTSVYEKQTKISKVQHHPSHKEVTDKYGETKHYYGKTDRLPRPLAKAPSQPQFTGIGGNRPVSDYNEETDNFNSNFPSEFPSDYNIYTTPDYGHKGTQTHAMSKVVQYPKYTEVDTEYVTPTSVYSGNSGVQNSFVSKATSQYSNTGSDYSNASPDHSYKSKPQYPLISNVIHYPEHAELQKKYDETSTVHGGEYTNIPSDYDTDYDVPHPSPVPYIPNYPEYAEVEKDTAPVQNIKPIISPTKHPHAHPPAELNFNHSKLKLVPSYHLFTISNLLKLHDAIIKIIEINGPSLYDDIPLINLKKIVNILLILAEHLDETPGSNKWYEKIFYIGQNPHPLHIYAYNLIRQRWLHELMILLDNNNFSFNILQNPRLFSFLGSWKFPKYVLHFLDAEELVEHDFYDPNGFDEPYTEDGFLNTFSAYDNMFANIPDDLENPVTHDVINAYIPPDDDIAIGVGGIDAEPVAKRIILMLQTYLLNKNVIENQENVIDRDNKIVMLKKVIWYLKAKGYDAFTIANLIRKLYTAVYSTEGKRCQPHRINFVKHMYDVIVPVLKSSGQ